MTVSPEFTTSRHVTAVTECITGPGYQGPSQNDRPRFATVAHISGPSGARGHPLLGEDTPVRLSPSLCSRQLSLFTAFTATVPFARVPRQLQRCAFDDTVSLARMESDGPRADYLADCRAPDGSYLFEHEAPLMTHPRGAAGRQAGAALPRQRAVHGARSITTSG
jgi:hypothetical protein